MKVFYSVFPGCRKMEAEVVRMVADMFHGDSSTCGVVSNCNSL